MGERIAARLSEQESRILPSFGDIDAARERLGNPRDVPRAKAEFMADSQVPWGLEALSGTVTEAAWRNKPSWYLIATDDKMIPPAAQELMSKRAGSTVAQTSGSHAVYVSQPQAVAALIEKAATAVKAVR